MKTNVFNKNVQHNLYKELLNDLEEICLTEYSTYSQGKNGRIGNKYDIKIELVNGDEVRSKGILSDIRDGEGDLEVSLDLNLTVNHTRGMTKETYALTKLITIPIYTRQGMRIGNNRYTFTNVLDPAKGWQIVYDKDNILTVDYRPRRGRPIEIRMDRSGQIEKYSYKGTQKSKCNLSTLMVAMSGLPLEHVKDQTTSGHANIDMILREELTTDDMGEKVALDMLQSTQRALATSIANADIDDVETLNYLFKERVSDNSFLEMDKGSLTRVNRLFSFYNRASNTTLVDEVTLVNGTVINSGTLLTYKILEELDKDSSLTSIVVEEDGQIYTIVKQRVGSKFSYEHLVNIVNIMSCELAGLNRVRGMDDLDNKQVTNVYIAMSEYIQSSIDDVLTRVEKVVKTEVPGLPKIPSYNYNTSNKDRKNPAQVLVRNRNSVSVVANEYKITSSASDVSVTARDVKESQFNYIDSVAVPESKKAGMSVNMSSTAYANKNGEMCNSFIKVEEGVLTDELVVLTAHECYQYNITNDDWGSPEDMVECKRANTPRKVRAKEIDYVSITPASVSSRFSMTVPFGNHNEGRRLQMAANQLPQYDPILGAERPRVINGMLSIYDEAVYTVSDIVERVALINNVPFTNDLCVKGIRMVEMRKLGAMKILYFQSMDETLLIPTDIKIDSYTNINEMVSSYNLNCIDDGRELYTWFNDEIVCKALDISVEDHELHESSRIAYRGVDTEYMEDKILKQSVTPGKNATIAYTTWEGYPFEDGIVVRQGVLDSFDFANPFTHRTQHELSRNEILSDQDCSSDIGSNGLIKPNTEVRPRTNLINYKQIKDRDTGSESSKMKTISARRGNTGFVLSSERTRTATGADLATVITGGVRNLEQGDKLTGLHGNKGVIAAVIPDSEMPMTEDGRMIDFIFNPLGVPSRMNIGQLFEVGAGEVARRTGKTIVMSPNGKNDVDLVLSEMENEDVKPVRLIDRRYGKMLPNPVFVGEMHILKLEHQVTTKIDSINFAQHVNPRSLQPTKSAHFSGGQSVSELVQNCLLSNGCHKTLDFLFAAGSDDQKVMYDMKMDLLDKGYTSRFGVNRTFNLLKAYLTGSGFTVKGDSISGVSYSITTDDETASIATPILLDATIENILYNDPNHYEKTSKGSRRVPTRDNYTYIDAGTVQWVNPAVIGRELCKSILAIFHKKQVQVNTFSISSIKGIMDGDLYLRVAQQEDRDYKVVHVIEKSAVTNKHITEYGFVTQAQAFLTLFRDTTKGDMIKQYEGLIKDLDRAGGATALKDKDKFTKRLGMLKSLPEFKDMITNKLIMIPLGYRPYNPDSLTIDSVNSMYSRLIKDLKSLSMMRRDSGVNYDRAYSRFYKMLFEYTTKKADSKESAHTKHFPDLIGEKDTGVIREMALSKRVLFSGRSTIVGSPKISIEHIEIPVTMFYTMYKYNIIHWLRGTDTFKQLDVLDSIKEYEELIDMMINKRFDQMSELLEVTEDEAKTVYQSVYKFINEKALNELVLAVREPALRRYSTECFIPRLTESQSIGISPLVCSPYNADFDGDQMAVYALINDEVKEEARKFMTPGKMLFDDRTGGNTYEPSQDMVLGLYGATCDEPVEIENKDQTKRTGYIQVYTSLISLECDLNRGRIKVSDCVMYVSDIDGKEYVSTAGRILINGIIPNGEGLMGNKLTYDCPVDSKVASNIVSNHYREGNESCQLELLDKLMNLGFMLADTNNTSISLTDFSELDSEMGIEEMKKDALEIGSGLGILERFGLVSNTTDAYRVELSKLTDNLIRKFKKNCGNDTNFGRIFKSGARGSFNNLIESLGFVGFSLNLSEQLQSNPIESSLFRGLSPVEIFSSGYKVRRSQVSTAHMTGSAGELTRLLTFVMGDTKIVKEDCGVDPTEVPVLYQIDHGSYTELTSLFVGQSLRSDSEGYNVYGATKLTIKDINNLTEGHTRKFIRSDGKSHRPEYGIMDISREMVKGRYGYDFNINHNVNKDGIADYTLEYNLEQVIYNKRHLDIIQWFSPDKVKVRNLFNCKCNKGICSKCYGVSITGKGLLDVGSSPGMVSAQTIGQPTTQMVISTRHEKADVGNKVTVVDRIKGSLNQSAPNDKHKNNVGIFAEQDSVIKVDKLENNRVRVHVNGKEYIVNEVDSLVNDYAEVKKGHKVIDGDVYFSEINGTISMEKQRYMLWKEYSDIYKSNGVALHSKHFETLVKSQSGYCIVKSSSIKSLKPETVYLTKDVEDVISMGEKVEYDERFVSIPLMCRGYSVMKGISCQDPYSAISYGVAEGRVDKCDSMMGSILLGKPLSKSQFKVNANITRREIDTQSLFNQPTEEKEYKVEDIVELREIKKDFFFVEDEGGETGFTMEKTSNFVLGEE